MKKRKIVIKKKKKVTKVKILKEFKKFIKEYSLISLSIAFVMGSAAKDFFQSFINNIIMPFFNPLIVGTWETAALNLGPISLNWGKFLSSSLNFIFLALVIFFIIKKLIKWEK